MNAVDPEGLEELDDGNGGFIFPKFRPTLTWNQAQMSPSGRELYRQEYDIYAEKRDQAWTLFRSGSLYPTNYELDIVPVGKVFSILRKTKGKGPCTRAPKHEVRYQHLLGKEIDIKRAAREVGVNLDGYAILHWLNPKDPKAFGGMIPLGKFPNREVAIMFGQPILLITDRGLTNMGISIITGKHESNHILTKTLFGFTNEGLAYLAELLPKFRLGK